MTHDPTTREGREELRRLRELAADYMRTPPGEATESQLAGIVAYSQAILDTHHVAIDLLDQQQAIIDAKDAEIERLTEENRRLEHDDDCKLLSRQDSLGKRAGRFGDSIGVSIEWHTG